MATELIVGLDLDDADDALSIADACGAKWFKVGSQLFTQAGPAVVKQLVDGGHRVMLDLKYHDIPNTVASAVSAANGLGASLITLHALGGRDMIDGARRAVEGSDTRLLAVTILTSVSEQVLRDEIGLPESPIEAVSRLARQSVDAGAHGIVCSAQELEAVRSAVGNDPVIVTPGIRPAWANRDDQARVVTPQDAARAGADFIVVARPILRHDSPADAVQRIQEELSQA